MDKKRKIIEGLQKLLGKEHYATSAIIIGTVTAVNGIDSIDVDVEDVTYNDVQLQTIFEGNGTSLILVPKKGSKVLLGSIENGTAYVMLFADKVDKAIIKQVDGMYIEVAKDLIKLNGDAKGGIIIKSDLVTELQKVNTILTAIKTVCSTPVNEPGNGAPSAFQAVLNAAIASLNTPTYSNIENQKVKHG